MKRTVIDDLSCCLVDFWATICTALSMILSETKCNWTQSNSVELNQIEFNRFLVGHSNFSRLFRLQFVFLSKWSGDYKARFQKLRGLRWDTGIFTHRSFHYLSLNTNWPISYILAGLTEGLKFSKRVYSRFFFFGPSPTSFRPYPALTRSCSKINTRQIPRPADFAWSMASIVINDIDRLRM